MVSSGSTLLNLALSDEIGWGFAKGRIYNIIGDSSSGKSFLALTSLAEAFYSDSGYKLIYDDVEAAMGFDLKGLFGEKFEQALKIEESETVQNFYQRVLKYIESGEKFVYVLDSLDALTSAEEEEIAAVLRKSGEIKGSYGLQKPKLMSQILRQINLKLKNTESILIIISQTRDNLNAMSFQKKTRAGGRALEFYCTGVMWLAKLKKITKQGIDVGVYSEVKISKNKITGKLRKVQFPIYYDYGIDDIGSMVDFLTKTGKAEVKKLTITLPELDISGTRKAVIAEIEKQGKEQGLKQLVLSQWQEIERKIKSDRKPRFERAKEWEKDSSSSDK